MRVSSYYVATSLDDALLKLKENPKNSILGGGLWMKKTGQSYDTVIDLKDLHLDLIKEDKKSIHIGSYVTLRQLEVNPIITSYMDGLISKVSKQILGPAFRNMATVGGTIFGRYPFSDLITALLLLDIELVFYPNRTMKLSEYLTFKGRIEEILTEIVIKKEEGRSYFKKVKTNALDFALLNVCVVKKNNKHFISVGSRPMVATLAYNAMEAADKGLDYKEVGNIAAEELTFMDSTLISKEYRKDLTKVYVSRALEEVNK